AGKGPANNKDRSEKAVPAAAADTSSLACYFQKGSDTTWYWGLTSDSAWFQMSGNWQKTPYTKLEKFFSSASQSDMTSACSNSSTYYGLVGYTFVAGFAAQKAAGYNYPIVIGGNTELWPQY
ncbi:MAG: hypothetical protein ABIQ70_13550, partial [Dokdonella sp.]